MKIISLFLQESLTGMFHQQALRNTTSIFQLEPSNHDLQIFSVLKWTTTFFGLLLSFHNDLKDSGLVFVETSFEASQIQHNYYC